MDALRGLAAVGIVVLHAWMYTGANDPSHSVLVDSVIGELRLGLMLFFVLSGYLLAGPWLRAAAGGGKAPALGRYALHRAARILPGYWAALIGAYLILHGTGNGRAVSIGQLPIFAVFAQNQVEEVAGRLNPPTWSLGVEVGFYLVLPLIGWGLLALRTRGRMVAGCAALVAAGMAWTLAGELGRWPDTTMVSIFTYLPVFACGIAAAVLSAGQAPGRRAAWGLMVGGSLLVLANGLWHSGGTGLVGHVVRDIPAAIGFAMVIAAVAARPGRILASRPLRALGTVSYGTYLWHMPVLYWFLTRDRMPESPPAAMVAVLVPALLLGGVSWFLVERPVLRVVAARTRAPRPPARPRAPVPAPPAAPPVPAARRTGARRAPDRVLT